MSNERWIVQFNSCILDLTEGYVYKSNGIEERITPTQCLVLDELIRNPDKNINKHQILAQIEANSNYGKGEVIGDNAKQDSNVSTQILNIRKLDSDIRTAITTVHGFGYKYSGNEKEKVSLAKLNDLLKQLETELEKMK